MIFKSCFILYANYFLLGANGFILSNNIQKCRENDPNLNACVAKNAQDALLLLKEGIPSLNIPPMDPLKIERLEIPAVNEVGAMKLNQEYRNVNLYGLSTSEIKNLKINVKDNYRIEIELMTAATYMTGNYNMDGKILVLPITGNGTFNTTLINTKSRLQMVSKIITKESKRYLNIVKCDIELEPETILIQFDNLFNGDPQLGPQMNLFLNEHSHPIFNELKGPFQKTFGDIFKSIINSIFSKFSVDELFVID